MGRRDEGGATGRRAAGPAAFPLSFKIGLAVSALFIWMFARNLSAEQVGEVMRRVSPGWLAAALAAYAAGHVFRGLRSRLILAPHARVSWQRGMNLVLVGYAANNVLPLRAGELVRAVLLSRLEPVSVATGVGTLLVERILDGMVLVGILIAATARAAELPAWAGQAGWVGAAVFFGAMAVMVVAHRWRAAAERAAAWLVRPLPQTSGGALLRFAMRVIDGAAFLSLNRATLAVAALSIAVWLCEGGMMVFALPMTGLSDLPIAAAYFALAVTNLAILMPSSPGYVGTFHYFCALSLTAFGAPAEAAALYAVLSHLVHYIPVTVYGLIAIHRYGFGLRSVASAAQALAERAAPPPGEAPLPPTQDAVNR
ncbi:MAG: flippase-like domain-containing protein [Candidatus Schekmanbacteria bacterium]|nr:flippase-like domain-containing protein [Candidatus Schekmanbacteria bacterium]